MKKILLILLFLIFPTLTYAFHFTGHGDSYVTNINVTGTIESAGRNITYGNETDFLGGSGINASLLKSTNATFLGLYCKVGDFDLKNISNYTQYVRSSDFNLGNISNNTYGLTNNTPANFTVIYTFSINGTDLALFNKSISLANYPLTTQLALYITSADFNLGNISNITQALRNGSSANFTGIYTFSINGTNLGLFNKSVDLSTYNFSISLVNYLLTTTLTDFWNRVNLTDAQGGSSINASYFKSTNTTFNLSVIYNLRINSTNITATNVTATRFTGLLDCGQIDGGSDGDFCADATGAGGGIDNQTQINSTHFQGGSGNSTFFNISKLFVYQDISMFSLGYWQRANVSEYLGGTGVNATLLKFENISNILKDAFTRANISDYLGGSNISNYNKSDINASKIKINSGGLNSSGDINATGNIYFSKLNAASCDVKADTTGKLSCGTDAGGGITFSRYNVTTVPFNTTSNILWTQNLTLNLGLPATGRVNIECVLFPFAAATTTGVQYMVNISGGGIEDMINIQYAGSATAIALCNSVTNGSVCLGTGSGGIRSPTFIYATSRRRAVGNFSLGFKSELSATFVGIDKGSFCRSIEHTLN